MDEYGRRRAVGEGDAVFICLRTTPMGFTWSLFFCHSICSDMSVVCLERAGINRAEAAAQLVLDGRPSVRVLPNRPALAPYVDNFQFLCWDTIDAELYCGILVDMLNEVGMAHRVECRSEPQFTCRNGH